MDDDSGGIDSGSEPSAMGGATAEPAADASFDSILGASQSESSEQDDDSYESGSLANMLLKDLQADLEKESEAKEFDTPADDSDPISAAAEELEPVWDPNPSADTPSPSWSDQSQQQHDEPSDGLGDFGGSDPSAADGLSANSESEEDYEEPILLPESEEPPANPQPPSASGDGEQDDSIEAYMNRLLGKVQDGADAEEPVSESVTVEPAQPVGHWNSSLSLTDEAVDKEPEPVLEPIAENAEIPLMPRSTAPESNTDMDAMRKLANAQARSAISESVRNQNRDTQMKSMFNYVYAVGTALCGFACFLLLPGMTGYIAVAMTAVVTVIFIKEGNKLCTEAESRSKGGADDTVDEEEYEYVYEYEEEEDEEDVS
jgi:hypothetical protein